MVYKSCGFLGFFPQNATAADFAESNYQPSSMIQKCGWFGINNTPAEFKDIPEDLLSCHPPNGGEGIVTSPGTCELQSCDGDHIRVSGRCVEPHTPCTSDHMASNAHYTYADSGSCVASSCSVGFVLRPAYSVSGVAATCPIGYEPIKNAQTCQAAASTLNVDQLSPFKTHEPFLANGCVVHEKKGNAGVSFNSKGTKTSGDQFLLCQRSSKDPCVKVGSNCDSSHPNYTWSRGGLCQGNCTHKPCTSADQCCPTTNVCVSKSSKCPLVKDLENKAKDLAHTIHSATSSIHDLSRLISDGVHLAHRK